MDITVRQVIWSTVAVACLWGAMPTIRSWTAPKHAYAGVECPLPERAIDDQSPLQTYAPSELEWVINGVTINPLAGFSLAGRVLSREEYKYGTEALISPMDLALGWGPMTQKDVLDQINISQGGRWYGWRTSENATIKTNDVIANSSNMHMVPANETIARTLSKLRKDDRVRLDGWLVEASMPNGSWKWRSSLKRTDTGDGACEVFFVCKIEIEGSYP